MPKKLLLPSARSGVLLDNPPKPFSPWWRRAALLLGLVAVLVGGADAMARIADKWFGDDAAFTAFAPAATLFEELPAGEVQGATVEATVPARIAIAAIGVDAAVEQVGRTVEGAMATPKALANVAWYKLGARPGGEGNAVFAGHVNNALGLPGVFKNLSKIKKGDNVVVTGESGEALSYVVETVQSYKEAEAPLNEIFANTGPSKLVLITCEGTWDEETRTFDRRLVVFARLQ